MQTPNFYGNLEEVFELDSIIHSSAKTLFIAVVDPISLAILNAPAEYNADIVVGEGQALGNSINMGGPLFGFFASKLDMARQMPGRIVGATLDKVGARAYALTLQAREQHIRRDKSTSNICSNQALCTLAATVYMSLMGRQGLIEVATQSTQKAHWLAEQIKAIPGFSIAYPQASFFREFVINTPVPASVIVEKALVRGIYPGLDLGRFGAPGQLMIAVTETKDMAKLKSLVDFFKEVSHA
ncbi:MAG: hypothetical protein V3576_05535 [Candidatus Cloacimonadota bacterium]